LRQGFNSQLSSRLSCCGRVAICSLVSGLFRTFPKSVSGSKRHARDIATSSFAWRTTAIQFAHMTRRQKNPLMTAEVERPILLYTNHEPMYCRHETQRLCIVLLAKIVIARWGNADDSS
jgi:hypothetical protein